VYRASDQNKRIQDKKDPGLCVSLLIEYQEVCQGRMLVAKNSAINKKSRKNKKIYIFQADNRQMSVSLWDFWKVCHGAHCHGTLCAMAHNVQEKKNQASRKVKPNFSILR
jgi:hypothetical protein